MFTRNSNRYEGTKARHRPAIGERCRSRRVGERMAQTLGRDVTARRWPDRHDIAARRPASSRLRTARRKACWRSLAAWAVRQLAVRRSGRLTAGGRAGAGSWLLRCLLRNRRAFRAVSCGIRPTFRNSSALICWQCLQFVVLFARFAAFIGREVGPTDHAIVQLLLLICWGILSGIWLRFHAICACGYQTGCPNPPAVERGSLLFGFQVLPLPLKRRR